MSDRFSLSCPCRGKATRVSIFLFKYNQNGTKVKPEEGFLDYGVKGHDIDLGAGSAIRVTSAPSASTASNTVPFSVILKHLTSTAIRIYHLLLLAILATIITSPADCRPCGSYTPPHKP